VGWAETTVGNLIATLRPGVAPSAVIAVASVDADSACGWTDGASHDARFEIGSITKTMTGTLLATLVDDGIVALRDEVGRWLDAGPHGDITIGELATHTSGLPRLSPSHIPGAPDPYALLTAEVAEQELRRVPPRGSAVADHDYSNFGYQLLGLVLERADQRPLPDLLAERVFEPLGMESTGVPGQGGGVELPGHARGVPVARWTHHLWGAGGVESTATDILRYLTANLRPPDSRVGAAIQMAQQPLVHLDPMRSVGLGWSLGPLGYLGHDGGTSGFRSMLGIRRDAARAAAVLVNDKAAGGLAAAVRATLDA
jgi:D-alanyl-D-alanine-carboxypeptidase/D-alanyl-D-alanine-endopeptidase